MTASTPTALPLRRWALMTVSAVTLAAVGWAAMLESAPTQPSMPVSRAQAKPPAAAVLTPAQVAVAASPKNNSITQSSVELDISRLNRGVDRDAAANPFAVVLTTAAARAAETAAAQAKVDAAPPPKPSAPPLPFTYLGRWTEGAIVTAFLAQGSRSIAVSVGESIDGTYRVDTISDTAIGLRYLPLDQRQELSVSLTPSSNAPPNRLPE